MGDQFYSELVLLEGCLLSVVLPRDCWKAHRNCGLQVPACPSAGHGVLLCVAQAEIQAAWEADQWNRARLGGLEAVTAEVPFTLLG